jgi:hypothetical protein
LPHEYRCEICNAPSVARRKDARQCKPCNLLKVLEYLRGKYKNVRKCRTCGAPYRPCKQKDLSYCGACETRQLGPDYPSHGPCVWCGKPVPRKEAILPTVCRVCLKNPERQDKIVYGLATQQRERIAEFRETLEG